MLIKLGFLPILVIWHFEYRACNIYVVWRTWNKALKCLHIQSFNGFIILCVRVCTLQSHFAFPFLFVSFFTSSWWHGLDTACDCGTFWTFHLTFLLMKFMYLKCQVYLGSHSFLIEQHVTHANLRIPGVFKCVTKCFICINSMFKRQIFVWHR